MHNYTCTKPGSREDLPQSSAAKCTDINYTWVWKGLKAESLLYEQKVLLLLTLKVREEGTKTRISEADTSLFPLEWNSTMSWQRSQLFPTLWLPSTSLFVRCTRVVQSSFCKLLSGKARVLVGSSRAKVLNRMLEVPLMHWWRRQWPPTPVLSPGESHGRRSLVGYGPWGHKESDMTEQLHFHFSFSCIGEGNGKPLQRSCLENPRDRGAWWAAAYGVVQSQTWLKRFSSSSSSCIEGKTLLDTVATSVNWYKSWSTVWKFLVSASKMYMYLVIPF